MSSARPIRPRGEPVIRAVLDATLDALARTGYGALTVEEIAERAGVNKTTVYRRWATKPDLVKAALTAVADAVPPLHETGDLRADLLAVARRTRDAMSSPHGRGLLRMLLGGCLEPDLIALAFSLRKQVEAPARRVVERAVFRGALRSDADPDLVLDTMSGWILHTILRERIVVTDERLEALVDLVLRGVLAPAARPVLPAPGGRSGVGADAPAPVRNGVRLGQAPHSGRWRMAAGSQERKRTVRR